jgi:transposase
LTDAQWRHLEPHLPPERPWTGHPNAPHRRIINGILWILRTGAPWRDLPERFGPAGTVSSRFYRWRALGVWGRILAALQSGAEERGEVDWDLHFVDATVIRAHQHAAGARRDGAAETETQAREALGRSQGGFSTKLHLRAEGSGRPITAVLTSGERHEQTALLRRCWIRGRSAVLVGAGPGCARDVWLVTRATAARPHVVDCVAGTLGQ